MKLSEKKRKALTDELIGLENWLRFIRNNIDREGPETNALGTARLIVSCEAPLHRMLDIIKEKED